MRGTVKDVQRKRWVLPPRQRQVLSDLIFIQREPLTEERNNKSQQQGREQL